MSSEADAGPAPGLSSEQFRRTCAHFPTGVAIASVMDRQGIPHGLTVNSFTSVSLDPPLILICLGHEVTSIDIFRAASHFAINILGEDQREISTRFARQGQGRFDGLEWRRGEFGAPLLAGVLAEIECALYRRIPVGDHDILIGEMLRGRVHKGEPLVYYGSRYRQLAPA
ncbi:MAG: flavin reductase family protein [Bryobacteraceae bacterium]|jgi:flavin reductase (DIM6/NTAB) family NADH-FMN oxidoreductase RutF